MKAIDLILATIFLIISSLMILLTVVSIEKNDLTGLIITLSMGVFFIYITYITIKFERDDT